MTLNQLQTYIVGVLQGYFPNKSVLDKLSESADGTLLFNGQQISGEALITDAELQQAITDTLEALDVAVIYPYILNSDNIYAAPLTAGVTYDAYEVSCPSVNPYSLNDVAITVSNVELHENALGQKGRWAGFFVTCPTGALGVKAMLSVDSISAEELDDNYKTTIDQATLDGVTKLGVGFYADYADDQPKKYGAIQYFEDEACTKPMTALYKFKMNFTIL